MGKRHDLVIKAIAAQIGLPREFRRTGGSLDGFLRNRLSPKDDAATVGAKILNYFCLDEDREFDGIVNGVKLALTFLNEVFAPSQGYPRTAIKDLRSIMDNRPGFQEIYDWVRANYH